MSTVPLEAARVAAHKKLITQAGGVVLKAGPVHRGVSDLLACFRSIFIAVEVKRDRSHATQLSLPQRLFIQKVRKSGGVAWAAYGAQGLEQMSMVLAVLANPGEFGCNCWDVIKPQGDAVLDAMATDLDVPNVQVPR